MKIIHHDDNDGHGAAALVAEATGDSNPNDFIEVDYVKPIPVDKISDGETVWIVDVSISDMDGLNAIKGLLKRGCDVIWVDHHKSSIDMINEHPELKSIKGIRDTHRCAAYLVYQLCFGKRGEPVPQWLEYLDDQDRHGSEDYKYEIQTTYFKLGVQGVPNGPLDEVWKYIISHPMRSLLKILSRGEVIHNYKKISDTFYRDKYAYESTFEGLKCLVVNNKTTSDIFGDLYSKYPLLVVWVFNGEKYVYTLYSGDKNIDCSALAAKYGGGGHPGAAGFKSDKLLFTLQSK
jgi:oligoribonuclease NrnB/cAMP/cGMP phosphodiesterase (DHH superfamily)